MDIKMKEQPKITILGVGGAGINSIIRMRETKMPGVNFVTIGTSEKKAEGVPHIKLLDDNSNMAGCGGDPEVARSLAKKKESQISEKLDGQDMVIIVAGLGRGTGTGASTVVAEIAREKELLTAGVVSLPFGFEGKRRNLTAQEGLEKMMNITDCVVVIHNEKLLGCVENDMGVHEAFLFADDTLRKAVQGISDLVTIPGQINIDFADLRTTISGSGRAIIGMGESEGQNRAMEALDKAVKSPLLDMGFEGARRVLLNMTGGDDLTLHEANQIGTEISRAINNTEANIIWGTAIDKQYEGKIKITVFATDFVWKDSKVNPFRKEPLTRAK